MKENIIGIDIGTSSIKAAVIDGEGNNLGKGSSKVTVNRARNNWSEQDMEEVWQAAAFCIRQCLQDAGLTGDDIAGLCSSGQGDGAWMIDDRGMPLGPAVLWNDNRAASIVSQWEASGLLAKVYSKTATVLWPGSMAGIMAWFRDNNPEALKNLKTIFCCKDWVNYCLTGEKLTDTTDGSIPFTNLKTRSYDRSLLDDLQLEFLEDKLPPIRDSASVAGQVHAKAAELTGLKKGTPVITGLLDVAANALGAGLTLPGQALLILGTTSLLAAVLGAAPADSRNVGAALLHGVGGTWLRVFGAQSGTPNVDWMAYAFNILKGEGDKRVPDFIEMDRLIAASPPGSRGILYHPFLAGERAPFLNPLATSSFFGITASANAGDLCRSVYEGVALSAKHCLAEMDFDVRAIVMTGGGTRSDLWCRIIADVMNCEISVPQGEELGIIGSAVVGGTGIGLHKSYEEAISRIVKEKYHYHPDPKNTPVYDDIFPLYRELITLMGGYWKKRNTIVEKWNNL
ncbi:MAG: carbohydrate kinase [Treponema sp.]|jgi:sugar (pentulose or hexulose) kinase|nr:carbohydrate kinase [Treponema sp.]